MRPDSITRFLRVEFSESQLLVLAQQLVHKLREISDTEDRLDQVKTDFAKELKELRIASNHLVRKISDRCEYLDISCRALLHDPHQGKKTIVRLDTGEVAGIEDMTEEELQERLPLEVAEDTPEPAEMPAEAVSDAKPTNGSFEHADPPVPDEFSQVPQRRGKKGKAKSAAVNGDPG